MDISPTKCARAHECKTWLMISLISVMCFRFKGHVEETHEKEGNKLWVSYAWLSPVSRRQRAKKQNCLIKKLSRRLPCTSVSEYLHISGTNITLVNNKSHWAETRQLGSRVFLYYDWMMLLKSHSKIVSRDYRKHPGLKLQYDKVVLWVHKYHTLRCILLQDKRINQLQGSSPLLWHRPSPCSPSQHLQISWSLPPLLFPGNSIYNILCSIYIHSLS